MLKLRKGFSAASSLVGPDACDVVAFELSSSSGIRRYCEKSRGSRILGMIGGVSFCVQNKSSIGGDGSEQHVSKISERFKLSR